MITNSCFSPGTTSIPLQALLFPSFKIVDFKAFDIAATHTFLRAHLLPKELHLAHASLSPEQRNILTRTAHSNPNKGEYTVRELTNPTILICGHASRDSRCGVMGPVLRDEFVRQLKIAGLAAKTSDVAAEDQGISSVNVGLTSHIGGHKWAGNVIIYFPWNWQLRDWSDTRESSAETSLAGRGIWYGRVEPKHVQGIVEETLLRGKVIEDLFRGAVNGAGHRLKIETAIPEKIAAETSES